MAPRLAFKATQLGTLGCMRFELPIRHEKVTILQFFIHYVLVIKVVSYSTNYLHLGLLGMRTLNSVSVSFSPLCLMLIYNAVMDSDLELAERAKVFKL